MSNPPVVLEELLRLNRERTDLFLLEETTLCFLGTDFIPSPETAQTAYWWEVA